jgi:hypothetical protein
LRTSIVTTTIHVPRTLDSLVDNLARNGHSGVDFVVVGDRKTPAETAEYLASVAARGYPVAYWDVERQVEWLRRFPALDAAIPWNCIQRRNIGYLAAYESGADRIISIDDDNFCTDDDFLGGHAIIGQTRTLPAVRSSTGWFNPCDLLETERGRRIYHRGFPFSQRWKDEQLSYSYSDRPARVLVNAGLWTGVPDVDAVCHLEGPCRVTGLRDGVGGHVALAPGVCAPFNSQNTAFLREVLPVMFLLVMGDEVLGMRLGRYDDIWMSFFAQKIIQHLGGTVTFGRPLMRQDRNPHDFLRDLWQELPGMILTDKIIVTLAELKLRCSDYSDCFLELAESLREAVCRSSEYGYGEKAFFLKMTDQMRVWADACRQLG